MANPTFHVSGAYGGYDGYYFTYGQTNDPNHSIYGVNIEQISPGSGSKVTITLKVGNKTASLSNFTGTSCNLSVTLTESGSFTPRVTVTNANGNSSYADCTSIYVYQVHTSPTLQYDINTSGPYYKGADYYKAYWHDSVCYQGATWTTVTLTIGSQTYTQNNTSTSTMTVIGGTLQLLLNTVGTFTPTITITDNLGASQTYSLPSITVAESTGPTLTYQIISEEPYFKNDVYKVRIKSFTHDGGKYITLMQLTVGEKSSSRTDLGDLSVILPDEGTLTPTLLIMDNYNYYTNYTLPTITITDDTPPSFDDPTVLTSAPYYAGFDTYSVEVNNTTAYSSKTIATNGIALKLGNQLVSRSTNGVLSITVPDAEGTYTPEVTVTDSLGYATTKTLSPITVLANNPPTFDNPTVNTIGPYYVNYSPYSVTISNAAADTGKSIATNGIVLKVGTQIVTGSSDGTYTINPLTAVNSFTPTVTVTDTKGKSTTKALPAITVLPNDPPTCDYVINTTAPYYKKRGSYKVTISNLSPKGNKSIPTGGVVLQVGNQSVSSNTNGTLEITSLDTLGIFVPTLTLTDSLGTTTTYTLPQIEVVSYVIITSIAGRRIEIVDGKGMPLETGEQACLTIDIDYLDITDNFLQKPRVIVTTTNTDISNEVTWYENWDKRTGTFYTAVDWSAYQPTAPITLYGAVNHTFIQSETYGLTVTPITTHFPNGGAAVSYIIAQAFFLLVGRAGGHALGIGMKPEADNLLDINMPTHIHSTLAVEEAVTINDDINIIGAISGDSTITVDGDIISSNGGLTVDSDIISGGSLTVNSNIVSSTGSITANGNITSTNGNIISTNGGLTVLNNLTSTSGGLTVNGDITSTNGGVVANDNITSDENITAHGNVNAYINILKNGAPLISSFTKTLTASGWSNNTQSTSVLTVTTSNSIVVGPAPPQSNVEVYARSRVLATSQTTGGITFTCIETPTVDLTVNILVLN